MYRKEVFTWQKQKKRADGLIERCRVIDGKTRHFYGRTAKEVQAKLDAALIEASTRRDRGDPFGEVAEAFWRAKEPCIKYGSRRGYRHKVELAKGWFEGQGMREITSTDINRELMHMAAQGYAYKSIAGQKSVLSLIWQYWCAEMHGDANPCTLLKLPQGLPQTKRRAPTEQAITDVKAHPEGFGLCPAIMMYAGLRLGEVMALQKKDLADGAIRVCKAVVWHNNYPELEKPKTDSAYRTVPILKPLQDALGSRLDDLADDDFIFGGKKPMTKSRYQNAWLQYCIGIGHAHDSGKRYKTGKTSVTGEALYKAVLEADFTAHQLRHEFASVLVECQISPQVAKELMGHADILTTQRWYAEAKASAVDEATRILNAHFE